METNNKPDIIKFLCGESDYKGVWFGERTDTGTPFWWRSILRGTIQERDAKIAELEKMNLELTEAREDSARKCSTLIVQLVNNESENQALKSELRQLENRNFKLEVQGEFIPKDQSSEIKRLKSELDKVKSILEELKSIRPTLQLLYGQLASTQDLLKDKK